jgi:RecA-family ATPase
MMKPREFPGIDQIDGAPEMDIPFNEGDKHDVVAMPYSWPDPARIPPREFLFGRHYIRKAVGATVGGGGRAKTTLGTCEAVGMASGRNLLTGERVKPLRAWLVNGEETQDELDRRVAATCQLYSVTKADCDGRLFVQSVRGKSWRLATLIKNLPVLDLTLLQKIEAEITAKKIDVLMLDPWVSFHSVGESTNEHMDLLIKDGLGTIADRTN